MEKFSQERTSARQIFPFPEDGRLIEENPPCFAWISPEGNPECAVVVYDENGSEYWSGKTTKNYIVPDRFFDSGKYTWNIFADGKERGELTFAVADKAVKINRVAAEELYDRVPDVHPRHLFFDADIERLLKDRTREVEVLKRNILKAYEDGMPERPMYHRDPASLPYREYFGQFRDFCDRNLVACSLGYALLGDIRAGEYAKNLLLTICDWNTNGPCSLLGPWGDEVGLSCARCLPAVYDMLYTLLDSKERSYVARTVQAYGLQCWERLKKLNYCENPGDSHAGRIPAYLGETALVLKGSGVQSREEAVKWLDYALDIYGGIFPYFGTTDGGWAEGTFYSTSYTKWYLPFFCAVERYSGCRFLDRPFYQRLTQFFLHFASPYFENHPFGDGYWCKPEDKEWPGFFAQSPCRLYAERFGPELARERSNEAAEQELYLLHLLDIFIPSGTPPKILLTGEAKNVQAFPDAGFVSLHTDLPHVENDFALLARASHFGSDSHRHPDQGSFALYISGTAMISPSGYFGRAYGTKHHMEWLNTTRAHNAVLIDGVGQKTKSMEPRGKIVYSKDNGTVKEAKLDLSAAYPMLKSWIRTFRLTDEKLTVKDDIISDTPVTVTYPLHTLSLPVSSGDYVTVERNGHRILINPVAGGLTDCIISDKFAVDLNEGEPEAYHVTMPPQYHISWHTPEQCNHTIEVEFLKEG